MYFIEYNRLVLEEPNIYQNLGDFTRIGDFTWKMSDCEELVGDNLTGDDVGELLKFKKSLKSKMFQPMK